MAKNAVVSALKAFKACSDEEKKIVAALLKAETPKTPRKASGKKKGKKVEEPAEAEE